MKMNKFVWHGATSLRKTIQAAGRSATAAHWFTAAVQQANEEGLDYAEMAHILEEIFNYDPQADNIDKDETIRQLRGY